MSADQKNKAKSWTKYADVVYKNTPTVIKMILVKQNEGTRK